MPNMSYCRFINTAEDLSDCQDNMDDETLSNEEARARLDLIKLCVEIATDYGNELDE